MILLIDRSTEPRYVSALDTLTIPDRCEHVDDHLPIHAPDRDIVDLAESWDEPCVIFTRYDDFFELTDGLDTGVVYFRMHRADPPGKVAIATERILSEYENDILYLAQSLTDAWFELADN